MAEAAAEPTRFVVGFEVMPRGLSAGDDFEGATILHVWPAVSFIVVLANDPPRFLDRVQGKSNIAYVEEDPLVQMIQLVPNDPGWSSQYGPQQVRADVVWNDWMGDSNVKICIVDSGLRHTHEEFVDGRYLGGWNFVSSNANPWDDNGHGTFVTGIAAATTNNAKGMAGVAQVDILVAKVLNANGQGYPSDAGAAFQWCADNGAKVISASLGASSGNSAMLSGVNYAVDRGALLFAAAGNDGPCSNCVLYPAAYDNAIAVACTTATKGKCSFSASGQQNDLAAPGHNIYSARYASDTAYGTGSGTSASAPYASGVAALLWSYLPSLTNHELRELMETTAQDIGVGGRDNDFGHGLVDAAAVFDLIRREPDYSTIFTQSFDDGVADGFTLSGLWHVSSACATSPSLPNYLGYHRNGACSYDTPLTANSGSATFAVDLSGGIGARLSFAHRWDTESTSAAVDTMRVQASDDDGATWTTLSAWSSVDANQLGWQTIEIGMDSLLGAPTLIRFHFDTVDFVANEYPGWHIDDVQVHFADNYFPIARAGPDELVHDGDGSGVETVTLDASSSTDPDGSIVEATWRSGGQLLASGLVVEVGLALGEHGVVLSVKDDKGASTSDFVLVTVQANRPPIAVAGPNVTAWDGNDNGTALVRLDGRASHDPDGLPLVHEWRVDGQLVGSLPEVEILLPLGTHAVELVVRDAGGAEAVGETVAHILPNRAPSAAFIVECLGRSCTFDASPSSDPDGSLSYAWDLGDGAHAQGQITQHEYASQGLYPVTLVVTDEGGLQAEHLKHADTTQRALFRADFDGGLAPDFTLTGLWRVSAMCSNAPSAPNYLGYHTATVCNYYTGQRTSGSATFSVDLSGATDPTLEFKHRFETQSTNIHDIMLVQAIAEGASEWYTLLRWDSRDPNQPDWREVSVNLSTYIDQSIQVRFMFDSVDPWDNHFTGWHVDDVEVIVYQLTLPIGDAGPDQTVADADGDGNETIQLDGSASSSPLGLTLDFEWRLGPELLASGPTPEVELPVGQHDVRLHVQDVEGRRSWDDVRVTVTANQPPVAVAGEDLTLRDVDGDGEEPAQLDGNLSHDAEGPLALIEWLVAGEVVATGAMAEVAFSVGVTEVTLHVVDGAGVSATDTLLVDVLPNRAPVAVAGPDAVLRDHLGEGTMLATLDGGASHDPDGPLALFEWSLGDEVVATSAAAELTLPVGTHEVTLHVEDIGGLRASDTLTIEVRANEAPVAVAPAEQHLVDADDDGLETVALVDAGSHDPDGALVSREWRAGGALLGTGASVSAQFPVGVHVVELSVTDDGGLTGTDSLVVTIDPNNLPVALADVVCRDVICSFDATASYDPDGPIESYAWNFGDGATATGPTPTHRYVSEGGAFEWTLVVTDPAGGAAQLVAVVEVEPEPVREAPAEPPADPHVSNKDAVTTGSLAPTLDIQAAWFEADHHRIYVGMQLSELVEGTELGAYKVEFSAGWTPDDATWGGRVGTGQSITHLRVIADWYEASATPFLLRATRSDGAVLDFGNIPGSVDYDTDIIWWVIPRSMLQDVPDGAVLGSAVAHSYLMRHAAATREVLVDTAGPGRDFVVAYSERGSAQGLDAAPEMDDMPESADATMAGAAPPPVRAAPVGAGRATKVDGG